MPDWLSPVLASVAVLEKAARTRRLRAAGRMREALTARRVVLTAVLVLAFAVPFTARALSGEPAEPAAAAVLEPPAQAAAPKPPALHAVAALPAPPPKPVRRRPRPTPEPPAPAPAPPPAPVAVATPAPTVAPPPPAPVVQAPAPPAPPPQTFDSKG